LLIVVCAPAIAVPASVFVAMVAACSSNTAPFALLLPQTLQCCQTVAAATKPAAASMLLLPPTLHCCQAAAAAAIAYILIIIIFAISVAVAVANFSSLLIVACAPAIAVAAGVFVATMAARGGSVLCILKYFGTYLGYLPMIPTSPQCDTSQLIQVSF
jgi:hypothetical protein